MLWPVERSLPKCETATEVQAIKQGLVQPTTYLFFASSGSLSRRCRLFRQFWHTRRAAESGAAR